MKELTTLAVIVTLACAATLFGVSYVHTAYTGFTIGRRCDHCRSSNIVCHDMTVNGPYLCRDCGQKGP